MSAVLLVQKSTHVATLSLVLFCIGRAAPLGISATPDSVDMAFVFSAIIAAVTQSIQILRSDEPIKLRHAIGEILGSAFLGYACAFLGATYLLKGSTTLHGLLVISGAAGWIGTSAIAGMIKIILRVKLGVSQSDLNGMIRDEPMMNAPQPQQTPPPQPAGQDPVLSGVADESNQ